jgi:hypothetical protein
MSVRESIKALAMHGPFIKVALSHSLGMTYFFTFTTVLE